ncbi:hypothetical protein G6F35_019180 [Rhizopus arrhizus]|nr:hypothetical protein G6F35_019180 [Rhizopus arrhizus]
MVSIHELAASGNRAVARATIGLGQCGILGLRRKHGQRLQTIQVPIQHMELLLLSHGSPRILRQPASFR